MVYLVLIMQEHHLAALIQETVLWAGGFLLCSFMGWHAQKYQYFGCMCVNKHLEILQ